MNIDKYNVVCYGQLFTKMRNVLSASDDLSIAIDYNGRFDASFNELYTIYISNK